MSLKDDFVEALRSVKRDFFRDYDYSDQEKQAMQGTPQPPVRQAEPPQPPPAATVPEGVSPAHPGGPVYDDSFEAYRQASHIGAEAQDVGDEDDMQDTAPPYRSRQNYNSEMIPAEMQPYQNDRRSFVDYGDSGVYDDEKTVISKNTIIRGALQTEDSVRLLGQILGDIECKANVVVAGKVRGNTTAANAYIFDAQVDGDVRCDDIVTVSSDAWVLGNIRAQQAEIDGKVKGNMEIRHMVSIGASSSILGDISTDELEVKRGAFVNGQIMMYSPARDVLDRFDRFDD